MAVIEAGHIYLFWCSFTNPPKEKFLLRVSEGPLEFFIINSGIHPFIEKQPHLLEQQVLLPQADHPFLAHDSQIDCSEVVGVPDALEQLVADASRAKGPVAAATRAEVLAVVDASFTLSERRQARIRGALVL